MELIKTFYQSFKKNKIIMHPGPINRGVELSSDVADSEHSIILNQVENGVTNKNGNFIFTRQKNKKMI